MLTIVADDLTGACDTGCLFAGQGPVPVAVWPQPVPVAPVRVVDTDSRGLGAAEAARRVAAVAASAPPGLWFKKIDSALRGHVGSEVQALLTAVDAPGAVLTPAFPAQGRTVVERRLLVDGVPIAETTLATDPTFPEPRSSCVIELLRRRLDRPLAWVPLHVLREGTPALAARLGRLMGTGTVAVADAETDDDLARLAEAALALDRPPLLVGSAGLGHALAARLNLLAVPAVVPSRRRWLIVAGSRHPATRAQVETARAAGVRVLTPGAGDEPDPTRVAAALAEEARRVLSQEPVDVVVVAGGETAAALYRTLEAERLDLVGPAGPGLAFGYLRAPGFPGLPWLSKAGSFGPPDLFVTLGQEVAA